MFAPETPVLSVALDAVSKLEGEDALAGLLTVFSKCKESLQDGPRLENMCWRLWHRERTATLSSSPISPVCSSPATPASHPTSSPFLPSSGESESSSDGEGWRRCDGSIDAPSEGCRAPSSPAFPAHRLPSPSVSGRRRSIKRSNISYDCTRDSNHPSSPAASWHAPDARRPSLASRRTQSNSSVGKIMAGLLPDKLVVSTVKNLPANERGAGLSSTLRGITTPDQELPVPPVVVMPVVDRPSTPTRFPKVVIVNPTPHPTPPMTPQVANDPHRPTSQVKASQLPVPSLAVPTRTPSSASVSPDNGLVAKGASGQLCSAAIAKQPERKFYIARGGESADGESPDTSASSQVGSNNTRADSVSQAKSNSSVGSEARQQRGRKGKEARRVGRPGLQRMSSHRPTVDALPLQKAAKNPHRQKVGHVGSVSSHGSKPPRRRTASAPRVSTAVFNPSTSALKGNSPQGAPPAAPGRKRIEIANTSSEFETTDDDESWASDESPDDRDTACEEYKHDKETEREPDRLREAALEAQRQREMFAKVPRRSYTQLNRSQSGLLSSLFHPDPQLFPHNHPYRHSRSSHDILAMPGRQLYAPHPLQHSKSAAAVPVTASVTAETSCTPSNGRSPLRLKGQPETELESDSGDEDGNNTIQMSSSLAMQKLAAMNKGRRPQSQDAHRTQVQPQLTHVATAPIPLGYPYNMPAPVPPSTPRTTRRNMLSNELSESLRRNLLWERQVSKQRPMGVFPRRQVGALGNGVRPLTHINGGDPTHADGGGPTTAANVEERRRKAIARNKSWADDYHGAGW